MTDSGDVSSPPPQPENPFSGMHIDDTAFLKQVEGRSPCTVCGKSRKFFCYHCYVPVAELEDKLRFVKVRDVMGFK